MTDIESLNGVTELLRDTLHDQWQFGRERNEGVRVMMGRNKASLSRLLAKSPKKKVREIAK
jgi:hypothetical protein